MGGHLKMQQVVYSLMVPKYRENGQTLLLERFTMEIALPQGHLGRKTFSQSITIITPFGGVLSNPQKH